MNIEETTFGPKTYLAIKKSISTDQIGDKTMYDEAGKKLGAYISQNDVLVTGPWSVIYFTWDEENKKTDIAIGFPVDGPQNVAGSEFSMVDIEKTKATVAVHMGSYDNLSKVHGELMEHAAEKGLKGEGLPVIAVEEYEVGPMSGQPEESWKTNVYHFHK